MLGWLAGSVLKPKKEENTDRDGCYLVVSKSNLFMDRIQRQIGGPVHIHHSDKVILTVSTF